MSGGFIPSPTSHNHLDDQEDGDRKPAILPDPLLKLTERQERRLRDHLDDRLGQLERDSKTHGFGNLGTLLERLKPILSLILQIPPVEPWSSLRISYLLTFSGNVPTYIASLPLITPRQDEDEAAAMMAETIDFLQRVDSAWRVVLRGNGWVVDDLGNGVAVRVPYSGSVGQTERIRLRSIVITGRAKILAWARTYGSFPGAALGSNGAQTPVRSNIQLGEWETEIMGMWNGILDMLSVGDADDDAEDDDDDNDENED